MSGAINQSGLEGDRYEKYVSTAANNLEWNIQAAAALYKHSSFSAEQEWRVNTYQPSSNVKVRASGDRLVPYVELQLCSNDGGCIPVAEIGIGPGFRQSSTRFAVEMLCEKSDIRANIYDAETPFRRT